MNPQPTKVVTKDEEDYSTLRAVRNTLAEAIEGLYKDFNAFEVLGTDVTRDAKDKMLRSIESKKMVYDILAPLLETIDGAIQGVDSKYKEQ